MPERRGFTPPDHLAVLMAVVASLHFVLPELLARQIPRRIPFKLPLVYATGVLELACATGLRRRAAWAPRATTATLLAIWPANVQMALDAGSGRNHGVLDNRALMWGRVPLQLPLIWAALQARPAG